MKSERGDFLLAVGIMTGNSLDGADCVLTKFERDSGIQDLAYHHSEMSPKLVGDIRLFRKCVESSQGNPAEATSTYEKKSERSFKTFDELLNSYHGVIAGGVTSLLEKAAREGHAADGVDLIGFHGQTCAHYPPSIAKSKDPAQVYTVQIGDGQIIADMTGISAVYDFRSDDIMNGGEGAPLAPMHHAHLSNQLRQLGQFPLAFCNAGNTGNVSVLTTDAAGRDFVLGWDTGPFNHFSDQLMRQEKGKPFDPNGDLGAGGKVNPDLLAKLFEAAVLTKDGSNFLVRNPPKSSDPTWYANLPDLSSGAIPFEDRLRTVQYFSAYIFVHSLTLLPKKLRLPLFFALCGGGWKNKTVRNHFVQLLQDDLNSSVVLPAHRESFKELRASMQSQLKSRQDKPALEAAVIEDSEYFGFDGTAMEARLMADAAVCRVKAIPFSAPSTTGTASDTVLGIIRFPGGELSRASSRLKAALESHKSLNLTTDLPAFDRRWSRASAGWFERLSRARSLALQ